MVGVDHEAAVEPSFAGAVLDDVGYPQAVRFDSSEAPINEVGGGDNPWNLLTTFRAWAQVVAAPAEWWGFEVDPRCQSPLLSSATRSVSRSGRAAP